MPKYEKSIEKLYSTKRDEDEDQKIPTHVDKQGGELIGEMPVFIENKTDIGSTGIDGVGARGLIIKVPELLHQGDIIEDKKTEMVSTPSLEEKLDTNVGENNKKLTIKIVEGVGGEGGGNSRRKVSEIKERDVDEWVLIDNVQKPDNTVEANMSTEAKNVEEPTGPAENVSTGDLQDEYISINASDPSSAQQRPQDTPEVNQSDEQSQTSENIRYLGMEEAQTIGYREESIIAALGGSIHPFDTQHVVEILRTSGLSLEKSLAVMNAIKIIQLSDISYLQQQVVTKEEIDHHDYQIKANLAKLKTEMHVMRKNDQSILTSEAAALARELESLSQQLRDEMENMRSEISIELNARKYERIDSSKSSEILRHEMENKYMNTLGDIRTLIESTKILIIRRGLIAGIITIIVVYVFTMDSN
ncbi:Protein fmp32, mitochondrial [Zancudomyces culisetae]|uniref:Protein fmp32, mitochondrial n=1 Tax=Zancudomyces culisetae TaxID=1213189 RepID=A0A1R1PBZ5_ZANCU|nr:Protein fmp32, mitochondrial [Zancudomyces culisetae]|eukprot:OMH78488.1 Protein fmp32, mitochondrial [Zancudomyces culisetae]